MYRAAEDYLLTVSQEPRTTDPHHDRQIDSFSVQLLMECSYYRVLHDDYEEERCSIDDYF